jgi:hypothetical protein
MISGISAQGQDLYIKKNVSVGGNFVSTTETTIKGARIRDVNQTPAGSTVTLRQCELKRTVTLNEQAQTYYVAKDPQDAAAARAAALATGAPVPETTTGGGKIDVTTTITDTGERKQMFGYPARHLKTKVTQESSQNACSAGSPEFRYRRLVCRCGQGSGWLHPGRATRPARPALSGRDCRAPQAEAGKAVIRCPKTSPCQVLTGRR